VLDGVDLALRAGEVHALLGENGAGKSTLMNVLLGSLRPDRGRLEIAGVEISFASWSPRRAAERGIGMVHQHSALIPALTVAANLAFGALERGFWYWPAREVTRARSLAQRFGLELPVGARVADLSVGERQRAEILRALGRGARILILDEPTAVLTPGEIDALFASLRALCADGCSVVLITHKLAEVEQVAQRITVLRRGRVVAERLTGEVGARELAQLMLGEQVPPLARPAPRDPGAPLFELRGVSAPGLSEAGRLRDLTLAVAAGEIVGIAGIEGNGQRELEEVLVGVRATSAGAICAGGAVLSPSPRALRRARVAHLSGDRESAGLVPDLSLAENFVLKSSYDDPRYFPYGSFAPRAARAAAESAIARYSIRPADPDLAVGRLSGGNAQKLAVAREFAQDPRVLVAVQPTRGLDVGSARFVHEQLLALRDAGGAVLLVSSELDEVLALADRFFALVRGELWPVPAGTDRAALGAMLLGRRAA
jgi:simple sugar transport system ATP-binding protein